MENLRDHFKFLAEKLKTGSLGIFIGAGISHLAPAKDGSEDRLPLWNELYIKIAKDCGLENPEQYDPLLGLDLIRYDENRDRNDIVESLRNHLDTGRFDFSEVHNIIKELPWITVGTTNYDNLLDRLWPNKPACSSEKEFQNFANNPWYVKLHGSLSNPHTLTQSDFRNWEVNHPLAADFLHRTLGNGISYLFVGYSFSDPHLNNLIAMINRLYPNDRMLFAWMYQLNESMKRVLRESDRITAFSVDENNSYLSFFQQLLKFYQAERKKTTSHPVLEMNDSSYREKYRTQIEKEYSYLNLEAFYASKGNLSKENFLVKNLYVQPDLTEWKYRGKVERFKEDSTYEFTINEKKNEDNRNNWERLQLEDVLNKKRLLVILGELGAGKSILLQHLLLEKVSNWESNPDNNLFPIYIPLNQYDSYSKSNNASFVEFAKSLFSKYLDDNGEFVEHWLQRPVLWLLDGIGEIRNETSKENLSKELLSYAKENQKDRFIVTSRPTGYFSSSIGNDWIEYQITDLSTKQSEDLIQKLCNVYSLLNPAALLKSNEVFNALQKNGSMSFILENPLLLTMVVLFYWSNRWLPNDRFDFYDHSVKVLCDKWQRYRSLKNNDTITLPYIILDGIMIDLAFKMMAKGQVAINQCQFEHYVQSYLKKTNQSDIDWAINQFTSNAKDIVGVFVDKGGDYFGFLHLSYQEFYAAKKIMSLEPDQFSEIVKLFWDHPDWVEVWDFFFLYCVTLHKENLLETFFNLVKDSLHPQDQTISRHLFKMLHWAGLHSIYGEFAEELFNEILINENMSLELMALTTLSVLKNWECISNKTIRKWIISLLPNSGFRLRSLAIKVLSPLVSQPDVTQALLLLLQDSNLFKRWSASEALSPVVSQPDVTKALIHLLSDPIIYVRWSAAQVLSSVASQPEVTQALLIFLGDTNSKVREASVQDLFSLVSKPEVTQALLPLLQDASGYARQFSAQALSSVATQPEVTQALLPLLEDSEKNVRQSAAKALSSVASQPEVTQALLPLLKDPDADVRKNSAESLSSVAPQSDVTQALLPLLEDSEKNVRQSVAQALSSVASRPDVTKALLSLLQDSNADIRQSAAQALSSVATQPEVTQALLSLLRDDSAFVQQSAAQALSSVVTQPEVTQALLSFLKYCDLFSFFSVSKALSNVVSQPEVTQVLLLLLKKNASGYVRESVVEALSPVISHPEVTQTLLSLLQDSNAGIRQSAAQALSSVASRPDVTKALLSLLQDSNAGIRQSAAQALSSVVTQPEVTQALLPLLEDSDSKVRKALVQTVSPLASQPEVTQALLPLLQDSDLEISTLVLDHLFKHFQKSRFESVKDLLGDKRLY